MNSNVYEYKKIELFAFMRFLGDRCWWWRQNDNGKDDDDDDDDDDHDDAEERKYQETLHYDNRHLCFEID